MQTHHERFFDSIEWSGCHITDQPHVTQDELRGGDVDEMLEKLSRRMHKNGRLDEFEQRQSYTKPSEQRREERQAQARRAEENIERNSWRGGVEV